MNPGAVGSNASELLGVAGGLVCAVAVAVAAAGATGAAAAAGAQSAGGMGQTSLPVMYLVLFLAYAGWLATYIWSRRRDSRSGSSAGQLSSTS